jgi:protein-S-isoprenylcysteine O-methyltransferase Ste14
MKKLISLFTGIIIFVGLPLLGCGIGNISGFFQSPYRLAYAVMMAVFSFLVVIFVPNEGKGSGKGKRPVRRQKISLILLQLIPPLILVVAPYSDSHRLFGFHEIPILRFTGVVLSFAGFLLMNWSVMVLGRQFSVDVTIQKNHKLITSGPYKILRHPRYSGIILFFTGIPLIFLSKGSFLLVIILVITLLWRIKDEEGLLSMEFGKEWEDYYKKTYSRNRYLANTNLLI